VTGKEVAAITQLLKTFGYLGCCQIARRRATELLDVGPHQNFYRDLQQYLDAR
jgi:hypothetical protein